MLLVIVVKGFVGVPLLFHLIGSASSAHPPDPKRVVWPLSHPVLREVELRPCSEHD